MAGASWRRLPLYVGGLLGPLGTGIIVPMFPELREQFDASSAAIGWGFTVYMIPFALLLLVSGTIGERLGRRRVVAATFVAYAVTTLAAGFAPNLELFLAARAGQGAANAFITPLLVAGLAELTPAARLGRTIGIYSSFQAAGQGLAPLIGGLAAEVDWRWAFVLTAFISLTLALAPPPGEPRPGAAAPALRSVLDRRVVLLGLAALTAAAGPIGAGILVGLKARDELGVEPATAGLLLVAGSAVALALGPSYGSLLDRWGYRHASLVAVATASVAVALLGFTSTTVGLTLVWAVAGGLSGFVVIIIQSTSASVIPENRGGAVSAVLSFRFIGHAIGPALFVPLFTEAPIGVFVASGALGVVTIALMLRLSPAPPVRGEVIAAE